jgi:imidazolonepropionase-like amidohydrolase
MASHTSHRLGIAFVAAGVTLASLALPHAQSAGTTVLQGATVIDMVSAAPIRDAAIEVQGGVIRRIGRRGSFPAPANARIVDVSGKTIIPGLFNVHRHMCTTADRLPRTIPRTRTAASSS